MTDEPKHVITTSDAVQQAIPKDGWLAEYVKFSDGLEACPRFRFFTACCTLGTALNNRVFIHRGDKELLPKLFPNLWVILLAPPGRGHKTSTINMGVNCLTAACPEARIIADKITPESLVKTLAAPQGSEVIRIGPRDATGLVKAPELSVFFGKQQYNTGLVSLITDLYDYREEWVSDTIMRGEMRLRHICISVIGGSTPDWLQSMLPQDAFTGGFMSRFVLVEMPSTYYKRIAFPENKSAHSWEGLVAELRNISHLEGEMFFGKGAEKMYIEYYENLRPTGETQLDAYQEREAEQILKLAMLLALSRGKMTVEKRHMEKARSLLNALMIETAPRIERLTTHPRMKLVQDLKDYLVKYGTLTKRELVTKMYKSLSYGESQLNEAIRILKLGGMMTETGNPVNPNYHLIHDDDDNDDKKRRVKDDKLVRRNIERVLKGTPER